jgi:hypothetical protein
MAILPTVLTMEPSWFWFSLWLWVLLWPWFLTRLLTPLDINLIGFWKSFVLGVNMGGSGVVLSFLNKWLGLGFHRFLCLVCVRTGMSPILCLFSPLLSPITLDY